jgi:hypothetical protein
MFNRSAMADPQRRAPYWETLEEWAPRLGINLQAPSGRISDPALLRLLGRQYRYYDLSVVPALTAAQREAEDLTAQAVGAEACYFMTTGASGSAKATAYAIWDVVRAKGLEVLVTGNAHISPYNALARAGARIGVEAPEVVQHLNVATIVTPEAIEARLRLGGIGAVFYSSPTYNGVQGDLEAVAEICMRYEVILVVDAAWGGEWLFSASREKSPLRPGVSAVVCSPHKSQGAPGGSSWLFLNRDSLLPRWVLEQAVQDERTTSQSSLALAALDIARRHAVFHTDQGIEENRAALERYLPALPEGMYVDWRAMGSTIAPDVIPGRVTLDTTGLGYSGSWLAQRLREDWGVHVAQGNPSTIVFGVGVGEGKALKKGLVTMGRFFRSLPHRPPLDRSSVPQLVMVSGRYDLSKAWGEMMPVPLEQALGRRVAHFTGIYPPGQALQVKGEELNEQRLDYFSRTLAEGGRLYGGPESLMSQHKVVVYK